MSTTRESLLQRAHEIVGALGRREPHSIPRSPRCRYTENGRDLELSAGLFASATAVRYHFVIADAESDQAAIFAVLEEGAEEGEAPVLYALRVRVEGERVVEMESVVARKGQASAFAPERLLAANPVYAERVPPEQRSSRAELREAADRYFDGIEQNSSAGVPFHASCKRVENGVRTTDNPEFLGGMGCRQQLDSKLFAYIDEVRGRRYPVIDEERGMVLAIAFLDVPGTVATIEVNGRSVELPPRMRVPRSVVLFELFKVIGGEIHEIEAFMINVPYSTPSGWET